MPKSFLNRFAKVYMEALEASDLLFIAQALHPAIPAASLRKMIAFNERMREDTMVGRKFGQAGAPWEFNLRDVLRWCQLITPGHHQPQHRFCTHTFPQEGILEKNCGVPLVAAMQFV